MTPFRETECLSTYDAMMKCFSSEMQESLYLFQIALQKDTLATADIRAINNIP